MDSIKYDAKNRKDLLMCLETAFEYFRNYEKSNCRYVSFFANVRAVQSQEVRDSGLLLTQFFLSGKVNASSLGNTPNRCRDWVPSEGSGTSCGDDL